MRLDQHPYSFSSNQLWTIIGSSIARIRNVEETNFDESIELMAEVMRIWKSRSGMRLIVSAPDRSCAIYLDGNSSGAIIRILNQDYTWEIKLEDRKKVFGKQILRLFQHIRTLEDTGAIFVIR